MYWSLLLNRDINQLMCSYLVWLLPHTEWFDRTTNSQLPGSSAGGWASIGSWGQPRPTEQGEDIVDW